MIIPSIDLMGGEAVQLIGGKAEKKALSAGDPRPLAARFAPVGEVAVIDLDAALGRGDNTEAITDMLAMARCRVGGGIRSVEAARRWLDAGAVKVILGTAAVPEVLSQLPRERVIAALDAVDGEVVVDGWRTKTGASIIERMQALRPYVSGFLITFVEREGRLGGTDLARAEALRAAAGDTELTVAGGITTADEIATLDRMGIDAQVGMALYTGRISLAEAFAAPLKSDRVDGLWPTIICDPHDRALGLAYSNLESIEAALEQGVGAYHSRRRGLWVKGATSGATQRLHRIDVDCDRDTLRFVVEQAEPGFCHLDTWTCFGEDRGIPALARRLIERAAEAPEGSYTRRLLDDPALLRAKLLEEAAELAEAVDPGHVAREAADVMYFTLTALARAGVKLDAVARVLDDRALKITRRPGNAKPARGGDR
ncbi:MAG: phosphoribosyl-ATP diphosphatase [Bradymonadia bacterium]